MKTRRLVCLLTFALMLGIPAGAQEVQKQKFNVNASTQNIKADYGFYFALISDSPIDAQMAQLSYTRLFWKKLAVRGGLMVSPGAGGYSFLAGFPIALNYCPGTLGLEDALATAAGLSIADTVFDVLTGQPEAIGEDIAGNLLLVLFRRAEFFVGMTPGYFAGASSPLSLTADAGFILGIPIWRFGLNLTTAYHYSITKNVICREEPVRSFLSLTAGISYLF